MGRIDKVQPETLAELGRQLNVADRESISLEAGNCQMELSVVLNDFCFQVNLKSINPSLNNYGSDAVEATEILKDHERIIAKLTNLQNDLVSSLDSSDNKIFEWRKLLTNGFREVNEQMEQKRIKLARELEHITEMLTDASRLIDVAPRITKPFRDKAQKFGLPCTFEAEVAASPEPSITWLFNDGPLEIDNCNILTSRRGSIYTLTISNVGPQHTGKYTLIARNSRGESNCSAFLDHVSNQPSPRSFLSPATTNYSSLSLFSDGKRESLSSLESPGNKFTHSSIISAPKFLSKLSSIEVFEGDTVRFKVRVTGYPEPEVRWFREGVEIVNSPDFQISKDDSFMDVYFLEIPEIFPEDAGRFTCIIQNPMGSEQCSAELYVQTPLDMNLSSQGSDQSLEDFRRALASPAHSIDSGSYPNMIPTSKYTSNILTESVSEQCVKPYFRAISKDLEVGEGRGARFDAIVVGKPNPDIVWIKDGCQIASSRNYVMVVNEKGINSLIIQVASLQDAGTYRCVASNRAGQDWFEVTLTVTPGWGKRYSPTNSMMHIARATPPSGVKPVSTIARTFHSEERTEQRTQHSRQFCSEERRVLRRNFYKEISPKKTTSAVTSVRPTARKPYRGPTFNNKNITYTRDTSGAPQLIEPIIDPEVREGERAILKCRIFCPGTCNYEWFFNNTPITHDTHKYYITVQGDMYILEIGSVSNEDKGFYQCTVSNDDGEVTCIGRLTLPGSHLGRLAKSPLPKGSRSPAPSPYTVRNIEEVKLSCTVSGDPKPNLTWYINDSVIHYSHNDFTISYDRESGLSELIIRGVKNYLNAKIKCVAENDQGRAETECILTEALLSDPLVTDANYSNLLIHQITSKENIPSIKIGPRFSRRVKPCMVEEGETVTLTAVVHGRPRPIIKWIKDGGKELLPSNKYSIIFDDKRNTCKLSIHNCLVEDNGVYSCIAYNPTGQSTCSATIYISPSDERRTVDVYLKEQPNRKVPTFCTTLEPKIEATLGEPVKFECKILREPATNVTWYFNGVEISTGHTMKEVDGDIVTSLIITDPKPANSGEYTCEAINLFGQSRTTTHLYIKGFDPNEPIQQQYYEEPKFCMPILQTHSLTHPTGKDNNNSYNEAPTFSLPLVNRLTSEGSEIFFVVRFSGEPPPSIQWFVNGNPVTERSGDCKISTDFSKRESILYIREVFIGDEGEYTCKAENISGVAYSTSHLYIKVPSFTSEERFFLNESSRPRFNVELTLVRDDQISGRHSVTKQFYVDRQSLMSPNLTLGGFEIGDTREVRRVDVESQLVEGQDQQFSETISIDRSDQSLKTLEFEINQEKPKMNSEIYFQGFQGDSRTSIVSEVDIELNKMPTFSETVSIDSSDSVRHVIPIASPPEIMSQENSELRRLTVESELELVPEPTFSETVAIDTTKVQEVLFDAPVLNKTSEITVHQESSLQGIKMEAEIILVEEEPQVFSETVTIDNTENKEVVIESPVVIKTSEITVHQESTLQGIKMEAEVILVEEKPQTFSETVSIDKSESKTMEFTLIQEKKTSELTVHQESMPKGMRLEAEIIQEKNQKSELVVERGFAPKFLVELVPTTVMDGSPVHFTTKLTAHPMPKRVTWYRNEKNCEEIIHMITEYDEETGESHLRISEVFPEDSGYYTCVATNIYGTAKTCAYLTVAAYQYLESESETELTPSTTEEIKTYETINEQFVLQNTTVNKVIHKKEHYIQPLIETNRIERITLQVIEQPAPQQPRKEHVRVDVGQPTVKREKVQVGLTQEFHSEGEEEDLFVEARVSYDNIAIVPSELIVKQPVKTNHFTNVPAQRLNFELDYVQNLQTSVNPVLCTSSTISSTLTHPNIGLPKPAFIRTSHDKTQLEGAHMISTDLSVNRCQPELVTAAFTASVEKLKPISHSSSVIEVKKPEIINLKEESRFSNLISLPENIILKLFRIETLETILYRTSLLDYLMLLEKELAIRTINLDNQSVVPFPEIVSVQTGLATATSRPITRIQTNVYFLKVEETVEKDFSHRAERVQTIVSSPELTTASQESKVLNHTNGQLSANKSEKVAMDVISTVSSLMCTPENIVSRIATANKTEALLYRVSLTEYILLVEKILEMRSLNIDSVAVMLSQPELVLLQTALAHLNERPVNRAQASIYFLRMEGTAEKQDEFFESFALNPVPISGNVGQHIEKSSVLSHCSSLLLHGKQDQAIVEAVTKITGAQSIPENIKTTLDVAHKEEKVLQKVTAPEYIMLLERLLAIKALNLEDSALNFQFPEIVLLHTGYATSTDKPLMRIQPNMYFFQFEQTFQKDVNVTTHNVQSTQVVSDLNVAQKDTGNLSHASRATDHKQVDTVEDRIIATISQMYNTPKDTITKYFTLEKSDRVLYRTAVSNYIMLLERILAMASLNLDNISVVLPFPETITIQLSNALLNYRPSTRTLTNVFYTQLEQVIERMIAQKQENSETAQQSMVIAENLIQPSINHKPFTHARTNVHITPLEKNIQTLQAEKNPETIFEKQIIISELCKSLSEPRLTTRVQPCFSLVKVENASTLQEVDSKNNFAVPDIIKNRPLSNITKHKQPTKVSEMNVIRMAFENFFNSENFENKAIMLSPSLSEGTELSKNVDHKYLQFRTKIEQLITSLEFVKEYKKETFENLFTQPICEVIESIMSDEFTEERLLTQVLTLTKHFLSEYVDEFKKQDFYDLSVRILAVDVVSQILERCVKKGKPVFAINLIYDYILEDFLDEYDDNDLSSLTYNMPAKIEEPADLETNIRKEKPLTKVQLISSFQESEKVPEYVCRLESVMTKPSISTEPMARKEKSFKNVFKTFAVATSPTCNFENIFELIVQPGIPNHGKESFVEKSTGTAVLNEVTISQKDREIPLEEVEKPEKVPEENKEREPSEPRKDDMFEEWTVETKTEKTVEEVFEEEPERKDMHEEWEVITKKKIVEEEPKEETDMFEEWQTLVKTQIIEEKKQDDEDSTESLLEEWEYNMKTIYTMEQEEMYESDRESEASMQSLYEEWEFTTVTKTIVEEEMPTKRDIIEMRYPQKRGTNIVLRNDDETISEEIISMKQKEIFGLTESTLITKDMRQVGTQFKRPIFDEEITCTKIMKELPLVLSCHVKAIPEPRIEWYKNGIKINQSPAFTIRYENGYSTLTINKFTSRYAGRYSCRATNEVGINESSYILEYDYVKFDVEEKDEVYEETITEDSFVETKESWMKVSTENYSSTSLTDTKPQVPSFEQETTSVTVIDGFNTTLMTRVFGYPQPTIEWFFKGQKIKKSSDFVMTYKDGYCSLTIYEVMPQDQGQYCIRATNEHGSSETSIYLTVLDSYELTKSSCGLFKDEIDGRGMTDDDEFYSSGEETMDTWTVEEWLFYDSLSRYSVDVYMKKEQNSLQLFKYVPYNMEAFRMRISSARAALMDTHPYRFPVIIKELPVIEVFEKRKAVLECVVEASPEPEITWFKNGNVITADDRVKITFINNVCTLIIDEVVLDDEAEYKCEAKNEYGSSFTWGQIYVETVQLRWGRIKNFKIYRKKSF